MNDDIKCPHCQKKLKTNRDVSGQRVRCPGCGGTFMAPDERETSATSSVVTRTVSDSVGTAASIRALPTWIWFAAGITVLASISAGFWIGRATNPHTAPGSLAGSTPVDSAASKSGKDSASGHVAIDSAAQTLRTVKRLFESDDWEPSFFEISVDGKPVAVTALTGRAIEIGGRGQFEVVVSLVPLMKKIAALMGKDTADTGELDVTPLDLSAIVVTIEPPTIPAIRTSLAMKPPQDKQSTLASPFILALEFPKDCPPGERNISLDIPVKVPENQTSVARMKFTLRAAVTP